MGKFKILEGRVEQVLVCRDDGGTLSQPVDSIHCFAGYGIRGDRHAGRRISDVREAALKAFGLPKGIEVANVRQFSAISLEELSEIHANMNLYGRPEDLYGCLVENLVVSGIEDFTRLPVNTKFFFASPEGEKRTAVLMVYGENMPCIIPGENISAITGGTAKPSGFPKAAINRRGVVGTVYCSGKIRTGDNIYAYLH